MFTTTAMTTLAHTTRRKPTIATTKLLCLGLMVVYVIVLITQESHIINKVILRKNDNDQTSRQLLDFQAALHNAEQVKNWRYGIHQLCNSAESAADMLETKTLAQEFFKSAVHEYESVDNPDLKPENALQKCPFVFIDLGSGAGDSIGQFIDSGMVGCIRDDILDGTNNFNPMHFQVDTGMIRENPGHRQGEQDEVFMNWVQNRIYNFYQDLGPEDYCVYGVEPNPMTEPDLIKLERHVNRLTPKPVRHLHFLTKTAAHSEDGSKRPFFLDTLHADERFPGSSLFVNHVNIKESKAQYDDRTKFTVDSISLTSLMKKTLSIYDIDNKSSTEAPNTDPGSNVYEQRTRQHLLLHIDVEGSEFHILNEAKDSGILCDFARNGNFVDIFIDYHTPEMLGGVESINAKRYIEEVRPYFRTQCGDNLSLFERDRYFMPPSEPKILSNAVV